MEKAKALLIEYEFCSGCHSCEIACQVEHGMDVDRWGIKINEIGPWHIAGDAWEYDFIPCVTDMCDLCQNRLEKGKDPSCVHHCQSKCMYFGELAELSQMAETMKKSVVFVPRAGSCGY